MRPGAVALMPPGVLGNGLSAELRLLGGFPFYAPRTSTITQTRGAGTPTITRATTATVTNNDGNPVTALSGEIREEGARRIRNLVATTSEDFSDAAWTKTSATVSGQKIVESTANTIHKISETLTTVAGNVYVLSAKVRPAERTRVHVGIITSASFGYTFDVSTGSLISNGGFVTPANFAIEPLDDGYLVQIRVAATGASVVVQAAPVITADPYYLGDGASGIYVDWMKLEDVTAQTTQEAGEYVSVGVLSAPYHGAGVDGVKYFSTDISGNPIPAATLKGAVVEAAATKLVFPSNSFTDARWAKTTVSVATTAATASPDGSNNAFIVTATAGGGGASLILGSGATAAVVSGSAVYAPSFYIKANVGTTIQLRVSDNVTGQALITITPSTGAVGTITGGVFGAVTCESELIRDGWYLYKLKVTQPVGQVQQSIGIYFPNDTDSIYAYEWNTEAGSYATTALNTTIAAVTRNKDVLDDQVASNLTAAAGTVAFTWTPSHDPSGTIALCGSYVDASNYTALLHDGTDYILRKRIAATDYDATLTAAFTNGTAAKISMTWGASGINLAVDGTLGTAHANTDDAQLGTRWQWGADGNGGQQAGAAFKEMYLSPESMSDAELLTITR